jgi:hypothetical protein
MSCRKHLTRFLPFEANTVRYERIGVAHVSGNKSHRQAEAERLVFNLKFLGAQHSKMHFTFRGEVSQHNFKDIL